jgi:hypothetical protein
MFIRFTALDDASNKQRTIDDVLCMCMIFWHVGKGAMQTEDWLNSSIHFFFPHFTLSLSLTHSLTWDIWVLSWWKKIHIFFVFFYFFLFLSHIKNFKFVNFLTSKAAWTIKGTEVWDVSRLRLSNDAKIVSRQMLISRGNEWINKFYFFEWENILSRTQI